MIAVGEPGHDAWFEPLRKPELMRIFARDFTKEEAARIGVGQEASIGRDGGSIDRNVGRICRELRFAGNFGARGSVTDVEADRDAGASQYNTGGDPASAISPARLCWYERGHQRCDGRWQYSRYRG